MFDDFNKVPESEPKKGKKAKVKAAVKEVAPIYQDEVGLNEAAQIAGLSRMRFRTLVLKDQVPSAQKNDKGNWCFSRKDLETWAGNREKHARTSDGKATYKCRFTAEQAAEIAELYPESNPTKAFHKKAVKE